MDTITIGDIERRIEIIKAQAEETLRLIATCIITGEIHRPAEPKIKKPRKPRAKKEKAPETTPAIEGAEVPLPDPKPTRKRKPFYQDE